MGDVLKLSLTTPPVEGRANDACVDLFAKLFRVPRASVTIAAGMKSRNKTIHISGISVEQHRADSTPFWIGETLELFRATA